MYLSEYSKLFYDLCTKYGVELSCKYSEPMIKVRGRIIPLKEYNGEEENWNSGTRSAVIDEFVKAVRLKYMGVHPDELSITYYPQEIVGTIEEIAEKLKEK